jgi:nucleoside-diphosphate-sugar epimerase
MNNKYYIPLSFKDDMDNPERVLVTGASGFIGSNLIEELIKRGFFVNALIHNSLGCLKDVYEKNKEKISLIKGDICDTDAVNESLNGVSKVFHFAGVSSLEEYNDNLGLPSKINIIGTKTLLENLRGKNVKKIILASSSLIYPPGLQKISEEGKIRLNHPYSISKREAELIALKEYNENDSPILIVRLFNIYGERQSTKAVIPRLICRTLRKEEIDINCASERDFTYIGDAVDAMIKLSESDLNGEIINLGSGEGVSLYQISEILKKTIDSSLKANYLGRNNPLEKLVCDNSKIRELTGWSSEISIEEGIKRTIQYIQNHKGEYEI